MATLNTLRTRGGIIVSIVIAIALLAFLLGDLSSAGGNMINSRKTRVGEINGKKIDYVEYSNEVDYLTRIQQFMTGKSALNTEELDGVKDLAWEYLTVKYSLEPGFESAGIVTSEAEQIDMVNGVYLSPVVTATFTDPSTGRFSQELLKNFVSGVSYDSTGTTSMLWTYLKDQMVKQRMISKYTTLVAKGIYVTNLEIAQGVANANNLSSIAFVSQPYTSIVDSTIDITSAEVKKYYDEHQNIFRQKASRDIEYVVFNVLPSEQDYADAATYVNEIATEFAQNETPLQYATLNSQSQVSKQYFSESQLSEVLAAYAFGANSESLYGPVLEGNNYTIARIADSKMLPDSIGARHILVAPGSDILADSIVKALKGGAQFIELANKYSLDLQANLKGGDLGNFTAQSMLPEFWDAVVSANKGELVKVNTPYGLHITEITYKSPLVKKVQLAAITHKIEPSDLTQQTAYGKASNFIAAAGETYDKFKTAATEGGISKRAARIRSTDRTISGMTNSREVIRWAFNADEGQVSSIIEVDGDYIVTALSAATEDGIIPLEKASEQIKTVLRQDKKAVMLAEKMKGNSLTDIASSLGVEIQEAKGIDFNSFYIENLGVEPALIGAVTVAKPNATSKPVKGSTGVFVFDVTSREVVDNATPETEKARLDANSQSYINERINQALTESSNVIDNRVKFF